MSTHKKMLISEEKYNADFAPLSGFYKYHVEGKSISVKLDDVQGFGVRLEPKKRKELANGKTDPFIVNTIKFSSSKKKNNVKNLMWTIRCLVAHPENISEKTVNGVKCYSICCSTIDKNTSKAIPTMKGLVACELWPDFVNKLMSIIKDREI